MNKLRYNFARLYDVSWHDLSVLGQSKLVKSSYIWMILIPVIANLAKHISTEAKLIIFNHEFFINFSLPFSWKALYFAALSFALGSLVYQMFCPKIIKKYKDYSEFSNSGQRWEYLKNVYPNKNLYFQNMLGPNPAIKVPETHILASLHLLQSDYRDLTGTDPELAVANLIKLPSDQKDSQYWRYYYLGSERKLGEDLPPESNALAKLELALLKYLYEYMQPDQATLQHAFWHVWSVSDKVKRNARELCLAAYLVGFIFLVAVFVQNFWNVLVA